jgi:hypothetical protein
VDRSSPRAKGAVSRGCQSRFGCKWTQDLVCKQEFCSQWDSQQQQNHHQVPKNCACGAKYHFAVQPTQVRSKGVGLFFVFIFLDCCRRRPIHVRYASQERKTLQLSRHLFACFLTFAHLFPRRLRYRGSSRSRQNTFLRAPHVDGVRRRGREALGKYCRCRDPRTCRDSRSCSRIRASRNVLAECREPSRMAWPGPDW